MAAPDDTLLDARQVYTTLAIGRSTFFRKVAEGAFPPAADVLGCRRWSRRQVMAWLAARLAERGDGDYDDEGMFDPPPRDKGAFVSRLGK